MKLLNIPSCDFVTINYSPHLEHLFIGFIEDGRGNTYGSFVGDRIFHKEHDHFMKRLEAKLTLKNVTFKIKYLKLYNRPVRLSNEDKLQRKLSSLKNIYNRNKNILMNSLFSESEIKQLDSDYAKAIEKAKNVNYDYH